MKRVIFLGIAIIMMSAVSCGSRTSENVSETYYSDKVEVYYFHNATRCITCKAVEAEAKAGLESLYGDKIVFNALNIEDEANREIAGSLKVSGQSLLLVKGDTRINIINEGFMYARTDPEKFKSIIKEKVDGLLEL